jgi:hypothetical protein
VLVEGYEGLVGWLRGDRGWSDERGAVVVKGVMGLAKDGKQ